MFHPVSAFIGLRYLRGRSGDRFSRFVSAMSTVGITIGVMALITVLSVMNGFEAQLKDRILGVLPQAVVHQENEKTTFKDEVPDFLSSINHVRQVVPLVRSEAVVQSSAQLSASMLIGIQPQQSDPVANYLIGGQLESLQAGQYQIFLGHKLARSMRVSIGDKVRVMVTTASQFTPLGRLPSQRNFTVAGVFNTGSDIDSQLMIGHIQDVGRLMKFKSDTISGWRLFLDDPFVVSELEKQSLPQGWYWSDWREQRGELFQAVRMEKNMMGLMLGLIVFVASFNIISALIMVVMEKQSEVAILKTQGMSSHQILTVFMVQGASSGIIGALLGGGLGVLLAARLNQILELMGVALFSLGGSLPIVIIPIQIAVVIVLTIMLSLLATLFPSYRAALVHPAKALRYE